jgi:nitrate reductase NapE component
MMELLSRTGLVARGVMYILIGWIAIQVASGHAKHQANNRGALRAVAATAVGGVILWLLIIGFVGLALWRLAQVIYGAPGPDGRKASTRLIAAAKAVLYGFFGYTTLRFALGAGAPKSNNKQSVDLTAALLRHPGGQVAVVLVGLVIAGIGCYLIYTTWRRDYLRELSFGHASPAVRRLVDKLGLIGGIARGVVFAAAGVFFIVAGVHSKPGQAKGMDSTLRAFAHTPLGPWLLVVVAVGLVVFGVYSCCEARWRRV